MADYNLLGVAPLSMIAGGTVTKNRLVKVHTTANQVIHTAAIADQALGAAMESAASGEMVPVQIFGKAKLTAAAAISAGDPVMPDSGGGGKIATSAGATAVSIGFATQAAGADGDVIEVILSGPATKRAPVA